MIGIDDKTTEAIIGVSYEVINEIGTGFLESVYKKSLAVALRTRGFKVGIEVPVTVRFRGEDVGHFIADLIVNDEVVVELKVVTELSKAHYAQLINYLKASGYRTGLLINFGQQNLQIKRGYNET